MPRVQGLRVPLLLVLAVSGGLLVPAPAEGQHSLRGRIRDESNRPVSFAQVQVMPGNRRVVADEQGEFAIGGLETGDYEFRARRIGYTPAQVTVRLPFDEPILVITMQSLPRVLDSVRIRERGPIARFTGIVVDDFNQPVIGAEVMAAGASDLNVRTDSSGHFRLLRAQKGALVLRVRKFGYRPHFGSISLRSEREDTIRLTRHATDLPEAYIRAESGFGRDSFAYIELDSRARWKLSSGGIVSREELEPHADLDLCQALRRLPIAGKMRLDERQCGTARCFLINGLRPELRTLNSYMAAEVEAFEFHTKDWTGSLHDRFGVWCGRPGPRDMGGMVIWLRRDPG